MPSPQRPRLPSADTRYDWIITDDGSRTLEDNQLGETYHSGCGALAESWCVYLINSGVAERLISREPTRVLEYGFGTGTAFFLTAAFAKVAGCPLSYTSLENNLLPSDLLADLPLAASFLGAVDTLPLASTPADDQDAFLRRLAFGACLSPSGVTNHRPKLSFCVAFLPASFAAIITTNVIASICALAERH